MTRIFPFLVLTFLFWGSALRAQILYLAAAGDVYNEDIAESVRTGIVFWTSLFVENLPSENLSVYNGPDSVWKGPDLLNAENPIEALKEAISSCPAGEEDGILVFWFGEGGFVKNQFLFKTLLKKGEAEEQEVYQVSRSELTLPLKEKKVRFAGLVSESSLQFHASAPGRWEPYIPDSTEIIPLMSSLFFETRGFLDLNSCRKGEKSLTLPDYGSLMIEAFGEFLETSRLKTAKWSELIEAVNTVMAQKVKGHKQKLNLFSIPKEEADSDDTVTDEILPEISNTEKTRKRSSVKEWQNDWDEIANLIRVQMAEASLEIYPMDYSPRGFRSAVWTPPVYYPEPGDLLIGINGNRIDSYPQFLEEINRSLPQIYLTIIDHRTGRVFLMRTVMGPQSTVRLGLGVTEEKWGGVRVTETVPGSPASRCQYLLGFRPQYYRSF